MSIIAQRKHKILMVPFNSALKTTYIYLSDTDHCRMRYKSSMFLSAVFKNWYFYVVFNAELNGTIRILCYRHTIIYLLWPSRAQPGLYMIGYGTRKIILKLPPFFRLNEENQEWENSKHQMKTKTFLFSFDFEFEFPALLKFLVHNFKKAVIS